MNPRPYIKPVSKTRWYLGNKRYSLHMIQELTSLFVGIFALILLCGIGAVAAGAEAYAGFLGSLASPPSILFHWLAVFFIFYFAISWFSVTPKAMPVQIGEKFLPGSLIAAAHYIGWIVLSLIILFLAGVF